MRRAEREQEECVEREEEDAAVRAAGERHRRVTATELPRAFAWLLR
jgi:hypothetical protein